MLLYLYLVSSSSDPLAAGGASLGSEPEQHPRDDGGLLRRSEGVPAIGQPASSDAVGLQVLYVCLHASLYVVVALLDVMIHTRRSESKAVTEALEYKLPAFCRTTDDDW